MSKLSRRKKEAYSERNEIEKYSRFHSRTYTLLCVKICVKAAINFSLHLFPVLLFFFGERVERFRPSNLVNRCVRRYAYTYAQSGLFQASDIFDCEPTSVGEQGEAIREILFFGTRLETLFYDFTINIFLHMLKYLCTQTVGLPDVCGGLVA